MKILLVASFISILFLTGCSIQAPEGSNFGSKEVIVEMSNVLCPTLEAYGTKYKPNLVSICEGECGGYGTVKESYCRDDYHGICKCK